MPRGEAPASKKNLEKRKTFDSETALEANKKSRAAHARNKSLAETINLALNAKASEQIKGMISPISGINIKTNKDAVAGSILVTAYKGDPRAQKLVLDIAGGSAEDQAKRAEEIRSLKLQNEQQELEISKLRKEAAAVEEQASAVKWSLPITDCTVDFVEMYRDVHAVFEGKLDVHEMITKGGRGSIKSSMWSGIAEETIYQDPEAHVVYTRRFKTDLHGSVYNQFMKTVIRHGHIDDWEFRMQPMQAIYKPTGQTVMFVGADKPISLKSFSVTFGYVKLLIHEECDEMCGLEQMDNIEDTFLRSDTPAIDVKIFNPPKSANNFMNDYCTRVVPTKEHTRLYHSYYYNVPIGWLGSRFFERAESFRKLKPKYYENNYLGEVTGTGGEIFDNVETRTITDAEINAMPFFFNGLDYGFEHPQAFERSYYDADTDTMYCVEERFAKRCKNSTFARKIKKYREEEILADSARPDSIQEMNDWGFNVIGAKKRWGAGKGRDYCWEWMQQCAKIVVDPERCPHLTKELTTLEHEQLRDGTFSEMFPTLGEDCVMALIYGQNRTIMQSRRNDPLYTDDDTDSTDDDIDDDIDEDDGQ